MLLLRREEDPPEGAVKVAVVYVAAWVQVQTRPLLLLLLLLLQDLLTW